MYICIIDEPTCSSFCNWLTTDSTCSSVTGIAVKLCSMALPSTICAAQDVRSLVGSMCDIKKPCQFWWRMPSGVDSDHGTGPRGNNNINSRSTLCSIDRRTNWPKTFLSALIWLIPFCEHVNFFLTSQAAIF